MSRELTIATLEAASAPAIHPVLLAKLEFDEGDVLVHSDLGDLFFNGDTYLGVGQFGGISTANEVSDLSASPITLTLSNIPGNMGAVVLQQHYQGRQATVYLGYFDVETHALIETPTILYRGLLDAADIQQDGNFTVSVNVNSRFAAWDKPLVRRYNNADQQARFPGDFGLEFVERSTDKQVVWGGKL